LLLQLNNLLVGCSRIYYLGGHLTPSNTHYSILRERQRDGTIGAGRIRKWGECWWDRLMKEVMERRKEGWRDENAVKGRINS